MPYEITDKLVIGIASSALFDLQESDRVFREEGEQAYRSFQREHEHDILPRGVAFPFMKRLLGINELFPELRPIEVILLSRNDPDTGQRVFNSIRSHGLDISRGGFLSGTAPHHYLPAFHTSLFLSANKADVIAAIGSGHAAGLVLNSTIREEEEDTQLRVAYDFDGVIADDSAEVVYQQHRNLDQFHASESRQAAQPHNPGPLGEFFIKLGHLQQLERERSERDPSYTKQIRTAIITARNAPADQRVITTLRAWNVMSDETFFLGGIAKKQIIDTFRPHIYFDDQLTHLEPSAEFVPSVHIPFGIINEAGA